MCCPLVFEFSVGIRGFVIGLSQFSFFFPWMFVSTFSHGTSPVNSTVPRGDAGGFKPRIRPPYPQRVVKGD